MATAPALDSVFSPVERDRSKRGGLFRFFQRGLKRLDLICRFFFGGLLLLSAGLKTHLLLTEPQTASYPLHVTVVEAQLIVGGALVAGCILWLGRLAGLLLFSSFLVYSLFQAASGAQSCACWGKFSEHVTVWLSTAIDASAVMAFSKWRPRADPVAFFSASVPLVPALAVLAFLVQVPDSLAYPRLLLTSPVIGIGELPQAGSVDLVLSLKNTHSLPVVIDEVGTSCPCLSARLPFEVSPGRKTGFVLTLDMAREPDFVGNLVIRFAGRVRARRELVFAAQVKVTATGRRLWNGWSAVWRANPLLAGRHSIRCDALTASGAVCVALVKVELRADTNS